MTRTTLSRSAAMVAFALAIPLAAGAQTAQPSQGQPAQGAVPGNTVQTPNRDQELQFSTLQGAVNRQAAVNQMLSAGNTVIGQGDIALIPVSRFKLVAADQAALKKSMTPDAQSGLQAALSKATVQYTNGGAGTTGGPATPTLAEHLKRLGVDPASVIAVAMSPKAGTGAATGNLVTIYYRDKGMPQSPTGT
jgi:hypothetical protein